MSASVDALLSRLSGAERRLVEHAAAPVPTGLTEPDPGGEERWEAGQVWAHLAEFPAYWLAQARAVIEARSDEPVPFGRVKTDPDRIAAIERDRHADPHALLARVRTALEELSDAARAWDAESWRALGTHPTRGAMTVERIVEEFVVSHLEEHADQLDLLAGEATPAT
ncbi:MAG: DinB family protein [Chloroflexi bacterium]|nr:DinB family protein [Chloroflexota bacterium]